MRMSFAVLMCVQVRSCLLKWQQNLSVCMGACMVLLFAPSVLYFCTEIFLPYLWILFQFVIPKPFMSIVSMNLCNSLSVFVYCCPSGFTISFYLRFKHPVCVSFTTIDLNLQLLRSSHCMCSSSHPALASLPVQCSAVCFMFLYMYLVKQSHSWARWSYCAPVSCAVTVHNMKGLQRGEVLEPSISHSCWFSVNQHIKLGWWSFSYEYFQKDYWTSELLIHCLFLGARPVREECCRNILFASVLKSVSLGLFMMWSSECVWDNWQCLVRGGKNHLLTEVLRGSSCVS